MFPFYFGFTGLLDFGVGTLSFRFVFRMLFGFGVWGCLASMFCVVVVVY